MIKKTRILLFDIETAPIKAYVWRLWKENVGLNQIDNEWYILSWAAKWLDDKEIISSKLPDYKIYEKDSENDTFLLKGLWELLDQADIVVAHFGKSFDIPKANARFLLNGYQPPSPFKVVDTKELAARQFRLTSNKLDYLARALGVGSKIDTGGFELWKRCIEGDPSAWKDMESYNRQDVVILEKVYKKLRAWMPNHPSVAPIEDSGDLSCTVCGSNNIKLDGHAYTSVGKFQRYRCNDCGHAMRDRINKLDSEKRSGVLSNVSN